MKKLPQGNNGWSFHSIKIHNRWLGLYQSEKKHFIIVLISPLLENQSINFIDYFRSQPPQLSFSNKNLPEIH